MKEITVSKGLKFLKPERVVFVISYDRKNKRPSGMICGWITICSSEPYMLMIALWKEGYTHKLIQDTKEFVVAVPGKGLEAAVHVFSENHGDEVDKFALSDVRYLKGKVCGFTVIV